MLREPEKKNAIFLSTGLVAVTIFVYTNYVFDPVNSPKFLLLGILAAVALVQILLPNLKVVWSRQKILVCSVIGMAISMLNAALRSESPFSQNMFGVQGRNTGVLMHLAILVVFLSIFSFHKLPSLKKIFIGFLAAGAINVVYCLWVLLFGDFINWDNQYKSLLGTLGNPNFISSLLAIFFVGFFTFYRQIIFTKVFVIPSILLFLTVLVEIRETNSSQGFIALIFGLFISSIHQISNLKNFRILRILFLWIGVSLTILGALAFFNRGPLAWIVYQETLGYRKEYWLAGLKMGWNNPFSGVGMDSYGDWYRYFRSEDALVSPGPDVVTNVAHNIYIDAFASGGFPLLFFYLMPIFIVTRIAVRKYMRERQLSRFYIALISTWFTYQLQALISINQIGLSIWGWVLSALIIALERLEKSEEITSQIAKTKYKRGRTTQAHHGFFLTPIRILFGIFLGIVLFSPPILNDTRWAKAYASKNPKLIIQSFDSNYFFPENSQNYIVGARIFEENALHEEALDLTLKAVEFNPRSYESWRILSELKNSSVNQKEIARLKMKQLDPKNRNV